jgi:hypothetical protein
MHPTEAVSMTSYTAITYTVAEHALRTLHADDSRLIAGLADSPDAVEGVTSFLEKRPPSYPLSVPGDPAAWLPWLAPDGTP